MGPVFGRAAAVEPDAVDLQTALFDTGWTGGAADSGLADIGLVADDSCGCVSELATPQRSPVFE